MMSRSPLQTLAFGLCLLAGSATAHEGHAGHGAEGKDKAVKAAPAIPPGQPGAATRDAATYFTDSLLQDQDGRELRFYSDVLKDRVVLLNVVFTSCGDACPLITRKLKEVRTAMGEDLARRVYFVSLSVDPTNDTPEKLKEFARKNGADDPNWLFLTGDKMSMDLVLSRLGQLVPTPEQHSTLIVVGDVANKRWSKVRPDSPPAAIAQRLQFLAEPVAGR
ncbi:hypothetical protein D3C76_845110 [compost metagenome]